VEVSSAEERDRVFTALQDISPARNDFLATLIKQMLIEYTSLTDANLTDLTASCDDPVATYREETIVKEKEEVVLIDNAVSMVLGSISAAVLIFVCVAGNYFYRKRHGRINMGDEEIGLTDVKLELEEENGHTNGATNGSTNGKK